MPASTSARRLWSSSTTQIQPVRRSAVRTAQAQWPSMPPVPKPPSAKNGRNRTLLIALAVAAIVAAALIVGSIVLTGGNDNSSSAATTAETVGGKPAALALIAGIPEKGTILGDPNAPVRMLQYEDLQCPICKRYTDDAFPAVVNEYVKPGRLRLDFRGLAFLGSDSVKAMRIALAAGKQNKLWDVVGLFYANQGEENSGWVTDAKIDEILAQVPGLNVAKVKKDAQSAAITSQIEQLSAEATQNGVQGTPSFFIARGVNQPYPVQVNSLTPDGFRPVLNDALAG